MKQIVFKKADWKLLQSSLHKRQDVESGAFALFRSSESDTSLKLLVTQVLLPDEHDYVKRSPVCVGFRPEFTEKALAQCEETGCHLLDIHTHPWSKHVSFSSIDDREAQETKVPYLDTYLPETRIGFVVFGESENMVQARIYDKAHSSLVLVNRVIVI